MPGTDSIKKAHTLILGAGASGLICAMTAARGGRSVIVLDHSSRPGKKVLASGGGRCNYTNLLAEPSRYQSENPHFTRSALARFSPDDALELLRKHGIQYEEREEGKIFLRTGAARLVEALKEDCQRAGVSITLGARISSAVLGEGKFVVRTDKGEFRGQNLVVALGGKSWAQLGATGLGYQIAKQFGHALTALRPGLVPLTLKGKKPFSGLSGVSFRASVKITGRQFTDEVLVTHKGLSGPAILRASSYWREGAPIVIDMVPGTNTYHWLSENQKGRILLKTVLGQKLPSRLAGSLAGYLEGDTGAPSPMNGFSHRQLREFADTLGGLEVFPSGTEGFKKAEVTVGGVDTRDVSSKTMESALVPGLYFTGEVLDVTGDLGGFNLHWAWASGRAAGESL